MSLSKERLLLEEQEGQALLNGRRFPLRDLKKIVLNKVKDNEENNHENNKSESIESDQTVAE